MESERIFTTGAREKCNYINRDPLKLSLPMDWMEGETGGQFLHHGFIP